LTLTSGVEHLPPVIRNADPGHCPPGSPGVDQAAPIAAELSPSLSSRPPDRRYHWPGRIDHRPVRSPTNRPGSHPSAPAWKQKKAGSSPGLHPDRRSWVILRRQFPLSFAYPTRSFGPDRRRFF
jgi:hypothetical protein